VSESVLSHGKSGRAAISGERFTKATPARTFPAGRVCMEPGCATVLSIYNATKYCSSHAPRTPVWARGRRRDRSPAS
jgi:hypothetical protein